MAYRVEISPPALCDIENAFLRINEDSFEKAAAWYQGLLESVYSLESFPNRCPLAAETREFPIEIRQLLYGQKRRQYRILFGVSIDEKTGEDVVLIYRVRHSVQHYLEGLEIFDEPEEEAAN